MNNNELEEAYNGLKYYDIFELLNVIGVSTSNITVPLKEQDVNDLDLHYIDQSVKKILSTVEQIDHSLYALTSLIQQVQTILKELKGFIDTDKLPYQLNKKLKIVINDLEPITHYNYIDLGSSSISLSYLSTYYNDPYAPSYLLKLCIKTIKEYKNSIIETIQKNPNTTDKAFLVLTIVGPNVADKAVGYSGLAIAAAICLLCKIGLDKIFNSK